jgi:hypothetical protein
MTDIERRLRTAMHAAVDGEDAAADRLIGLVIRRHRHHRTLVACIAILIALALAVPALIALRGGLDASGPPLNHGKRPASQLPIRMSGLRMPRGTNFQLLVTAFGHNFGGADWYSTATGRFEPIADLPSLEAGYEVTRVDGGWVLWPYSQLASSGIAPQPCPASQCADEPVTYYFVADGARAATRIGLAYAFGGLAAASRPGALWLVTYPQPTSLLSDGGYAQLVSTTGVVLGPRYHLPGDLYVDRGVGSDLLLRNSAGTEYSLWDPAAGVVIRSFPNVIAAGPDQVVWSIGSPGSPVHVTDVATGKTMTTRIPGDDPANLNATISDDGLLLAMRLPSGQLAVLNTGTGVLTAIRGTAVSTSDWQHFAWQNGGHRLFISAGPNDYAPYQIAYWQPGHARLVVATIPNQSGISDFYSADLG